MFAVSCSVLILTLTCHIYSTFVAYNIIHEACLKGDNVIMNATNAYHALCNFKSFISSSVAPLHANLFWCLLNKYAQ